MLKEVRSFLEEILVRNSKKGRSFQNLEIYLKRLKPVLKKWMRIILSFIPNKAIEKFLKAFSTLHNKPFGKIHNPNKLLRLYTEIDENFVSLEVEVFLNSGLDYIVFTKKDI